MRQAPLFGIGYTEYAEEIGQVAHNSYVHAFTELGLFGGTLFVSAFYLAFVGVWRLTPDKMEEANPELIRLRPYLLALIVMCFFTARVRQPGALAQPFERGTG